MQTRNLFGPPDLSGRTLCTKFHPQPCKLLLSCYAFCLALLVSLLRLLHIKSYKKTLSLSETISFSVRKGMNRSRVMSIYSWQEKLPRSSSFFFLIPSPTPARSLNRSKRVPTTYLSFLPPSFTTGGGKKHLLKLIEQLRIRVGMTPTVWKHQKADSLPRSGFRRCLLMVIAKISFLT